MMKNLKFLVFTFIAVFAFTACQEDDDLEFVATEATDLVFSTTFLSNYVLNPSVSDNLAERFTWNNADFGVATNVTYSLQAATLEDFSDYISGDALYNLGNTTGNEIPVTVGQMIDLAEAAGLVNVAPDNTGMLYFRLMATVGDGSLPSMSAVQGLNVELQESTTMEGGDCEVDILYGVGAGLPMAGWDWGTPVELACTQDGVWSGNVEFQSTVDNNNFRFFTVLDDWASGRNYPWYVDAGYTIDSNLVDAMDGDNNFAFVGTDGTYYLTIDTNSLEITLGPPQGSGTCEVDTLYGVGAGLVDTGWDWGNPGEFSCVSDGIWSGTVALQSTADNNNFRFFTVLDDWASGRNYPFYADAGYTIDSDLVDAMDGDNNFAFVGTDGTYTITIDTNNLTISLTPAEVDVTCEFDVLYGVGAAIVGTGWDWGNPAQFACTADGVWSGDIELTNDAFRFFTILDDWASGRNYPYYVDAGYTIDADLVDAGDGDNNFSFVGTPGTYSVTIDTNNLTITIE